VQIRRSAGTIVARSRRAARYNKSRGGNETSACRPTRLEPRFIYEPCEGSTAAPGCSPSLSLSLSLSRDTARAGEFYNTPSDPEPLRYPAPLPREPARDCARILIRHRRGDARAFWTIFRLAGTSSHVAAVRDYLWIAYNVAGDAAT